MRARIGNPFHDQHELAQPWALHVYDFVALPHTDPHGVARAIEVVCPDLAVYGRRAPSAVRQLGPTGFQVVEEPRDDDPSKRGWVSGAVWTSERPDGSLYVALGTYAQPCTATRCAAGHRGMQIHQGRALTTDEQRAIKDLIGESDDWPLGAGYDVEVLSGLGFLPVDAPLLGVTVDESAVYRALDVLLRQDPTTWAFKVKQLDAAGVEVAFARQDPLVWDVLPKYFRLKEAA